VVENKDPLWYYGSSSDGDLCQKGMSGVINEDLRSGETFAKYKKVAEKTVVERDSVESAASFVNGAPSRLRGVDAGVLWDSGAAGLRALDKEV
jgi:hypothetical protein